MNQLIYQTNKSVALRGFELESTATRRHKLLTKRLETAMDGTLGGRSYQASRFVAGWVGTVPRILGTVPASHSCDNYGTYSKPISQPGWNSGMSRIRPHQPDLGLELNPRCTRKAAFPDKKGHVAPRAADGRPPFELEAMLRVHFPQQRFELSDATMEESLFDVPLHREFADFSCNARMPDRADTKKQATAWVACESRIPATLAGCFNCPRESPADVSRRFRPLHSPRRPARARQFWRPRTR